MRNIALVFVGCVFVLGALFASGSLRFRAAQASSGKAAEPNSEPRYDSTGALIRPKGYETWVFVGSSTGLTYEGGSQRSGTGEFHDVYIRPESYHEYARSGKFPEKTVLVLALYPPNEKVSPAKGGYFEGDLDGIAVAVKDHQHFAEGWAYFNFGHVPDLKETATANLKENCYSCHNQHAADDNVFVQFYPILRPIMQAHQSRQQ